MTKQGSGAGQVKAAPKTLKDLTGGVILEQYSTPLVAPQKDNRAHPDAAVAQTVANMVFAGMSQDMICRVLKMSMDTLYRYYKHELETGQAAMVNDIALSLAQRAKAGSDTAAIFLLKTRGNGKFSEKTSLELSGQVEITHKAGLVQELATMISAPNVIEGEKAEPV